ncbi:MoxR family ATPase [Streptomyces sp. NPDC048442]|uniref:MoxR family ATPase n=1 Tax=Streptomyces sp. NPDC048442 TaxID=3154823 RepID=UPI003429506B
MSVHEWLIYQGKGDPAPDRIDSLPEPPRWRRFDGTPLTGAAAEAPPLDAASTRRLGDRTALSAQDPTSLQLINAALYLRRPLLVTGDPGTGKSTLAHEIAYELGLGRVLQWPVVSRTELKGGLYSYDAIGRLQDAQLYGRQEARQEARLEARREARQEVAQELRSEARQELRPVDGGASGDTGLDRTGGDTGRDRTGGDSGLDRTGGDTGRDRTRSDTSTDIGRYVRLGPLGTALLPTVRPRVLLIDELDKSDIDLPNDLLNVVEEGEFDIPELERIADRPGQRTVDVLSDDGRRVPVTGGQVRCHAFPVIVMTSNGEREFPAPLLRRCIHVHLDPARGERLAAMVQAHFGERADETHQDLVDLFTEDNGGELRPTDQLLNAIYLTRNAQQQGLGRLLLRPAAEHGQR